MPDSFTPATVIRLPLILSGAEMAGNYRTIAKVVENRQKAVQVDLSTVDRLLPTHVCFLFRLLQHCAREDVALLWQSAGKQVSLDLKAYDLWVTAPSPARSSGAALVPRRPSPVELLDVCADEFTADSASINRALESFVQRMTKIRIPQTNVYALRTLFYEIATNIRLHANLRPNSRVRFAARTWSSGTAMTFADYGREFDPTAPGVIRTMASSDGGRQGFGIPMIRRLCNQIRYDRIDGLLNRLFIMREWRYEFMESIPITRNSIGDRIAVITPKHTIDNSNVGEFLEAIESAYASGNRFIVLDMQHLDFLSSAGVGVVFSFVDKFRRRSGDIVLCNLSDAIVYILTELDVADYLTVTETEEDALASCRTSLSTQPAPCN